jgi:cytochrome P450
MTWSTHVLSTTPDVQDRLRDEILDLLRGNPTPDYADIDRLQYLTNFCREVLRVHTSSKDFRSLTIVDLQSRLLNF